ncbi:MAG: VWA domain-containing protein [Acidimicrobiales bacterium]
MSDDGLPVGFPFAAVVGMDEVKLALLIGAVEGRLGGVLLRGQKGSAKTTLARGLAELLPGSPPFVELPLGATEDRVVGTLDIGAALREGERRFHPGLLQTADGGVLYVDEVNLLADHLVDVLLDVAVSGVNRVEREGVSWAHRSRFLLIGSMNPEEGELRPQLLDRFGLAVDVSSPAEPSIRAEAVRRRLAFDADPTAFRTAWAAETTLLRDRLSSCSIASLPPDVIDAASHLASSLGADGLRADLSLCRAAAGLAGLEGRAEASLEDLRRVAPLALGHRRRRGPFDEPGVTPGEIDQSLDAPGRSRPGSLPGAQPEARDKEASSDGGENREADEKRHATSGADAPPPDTGPPDTGPPDTGPPNLLVLPPSERRKALSGGEAESSGRSRRAAPEQARSGRIVGSRPFDTGGPGGARLDVPATVLAAAERRSGAAGSKATAVVQSSDLREVISERRRSHLIVLCVDASGSMGAKDRVVAARSAVLRLLTDAYQARDRVAVVSFSGTGASVLLRPTGSVEVARERLESIPTGGRTPLAEGILRALELCTSPGAKTLSPVLVVISDGRATAAPPGIDADPFASALEAGSRVRAAKIPALVVDVESGSVPLGLGAQLASAMQARHVQMGPPQAEGIDRAVRSMLS